MRELRRMPAGDVPALLAGLRAALDGTGPAVLPVPGSGPRSGLRSESPRGGGARSVEEAAGGLEAIREVPSRVALVIETSGSTGVPKRVALSADALLASAAASDAAVAPQAATAASDRPVVKQWLMCLPGHYVAGVNVLVRSIAAGTDPVLMPEGHFDPAAFRDTALAMTGTERYVSLVPVQLARLVDAADADEALRAVLRGFAAVLVGGQALPAPLRQRAAALGVRVVRTYGSSETSGGCVYDGVPIGPARARVVDGLLELAGPTLAEGYLDDPDRTATAFTVGDGVRWYRTGDLGEVDAAGRVTVLGRSDNVIISGGEKVLLDAVERRLRTLPGLGDAVVVAAPSAEWGQVPVVVTTRADASLAQLRAEAAAELGRAAAPARVVVVAAIPHLPSGKPDRVALTALAASV